MGYTQTAFAAALPCLLLFSGGANARSLRSEPSIRQLTSDGCTKGMMYHLIEGQMGNCGSPCNYGSKAIMKNVEECAKYCLDTKGCKSAFYRVSDGLCSMKNVKWDSSELSISDDPEKKAVLIAPCDKPDPPPDWKMCLHAKDYDVTWGVSYTCGKSCDLGDTLEVKNQAQCIDACMKDSGCKCAFYDPSSNKCCMKNLRCDHPAMGMSKNAPTKYNAIMKCTHIRQCVGGPHKSSSPKISELGESVQYITDKREELCVCSSKNFEPADWMCVPLKPVTCQGGPYYADEPAESADGTKVLVTTKHANEECTCKVDKEKRTFKWDCEPKEWSPCDSDDDCVATYGICGGTNRKGRTTRCCSNNDRCILQNQYYAQCVPRTQPVTSEWIGSVLSDCPNGNE